MTVSGLTIEQEATTKGLNRPRDSFPEWCIDACRGDLLLALDLAVRMYTAMRQAEAATGLAGSTGSTASG
jgi:hypothetical protein